MTRSVPTYALTAAMFAMAVVVPASAWGQGPRRGGGPAVGGPAANRGPLGNRGPLDNRGPLGRPPRMPKAGIPKQDAPPPRRSAELDRLEQMSPEERQKALDRLPPERRQRVEEGLERYRAMNPENRERLRNFERMPEEQRDAIRQSFRRMQDLPLGRRAMVRRELQQLRGMSDAERETRMQSESFRRRFDANEQGLIRDTVANMPPEPE